MRRTRRTTTRATTPTNQAPTKVETPLGVAIAALSVCSLWPSASCSLQAEAARAVGWWLE